jgi:hypothetical protein
VPQILVVTDTKDSDGAVVYRERISRADLESDHFSGQLVERIGWALGDASQLEADGWMPQLRPPLKGAARKSAARPVPRRARGAAPRRRARA